MRIWKTLMLLSVISSATAQNQTNTFNTELLKGIKPRNIGPAGMSGRVTGIAVPEEHPEIIYVGTASGGVWKTVSGGIEWYPVFDKQPVQSIGSVAVSNKNNDIVWTGTGEGNPRNSHNSGEGIYKSLDAGRTWQCMGLKESKTIHRILIHPDNPEIVYAGVTGSAWGPNSERGVFKTIDGGKTWKKILFVNDSTGCADLIMDPSNPNKLFAAMWQYNRQPHTFTSGGKGSGMYISYDGGDTWHKKTHKHGLPEGNLGRIGLAVSASNPDVVYALVESKKTALYRSNDGGATFNSVATNNIGNRPFYYCEIYVDPTDENTLYNLYSVVSRSIDGGKSFQTILPYYGVHPDHHAWYIHPGNPKFMINGNDGGLNLTYDGGRTWRFVSNLPVGQFYHVQVDNEKPYNVYGGLQDNGSWIGPSEVWQYGGINNHHWQEVLFGDGFDVMPDATDIKYGYAMYQGGNLYRFDRTTGKSSFIRPNHPENKILRFNWNAALAQDPFHKSTIYFGSQYVHKSSNQGQSWQIISPDLTTNDTTKQKQSKSGGITIDATAAENHTTILCIAPSPVKEGVLWAGTDDGNIQVTKDGGLNWVNVAANIKDAPGGAWIPQIHTSLYNDAEAFVVMNDYRRNNWSAYVFHTKDYGKTWKRIADDKQISSFVCSFIQDPSQPNLMFIGADNGLYFSLDAGTTWNKWNDSFPSVQVSDMVIQQRENDLILGTFGRAIWIIDDITALRELAINPKLKDKSLHLFKPLYSEMVTYKSVNGMRFGADAEYSGANEPSGAAITFWLPKPGDPKTGTTNKPLNDKKLTPEKTDSAETNKPDWKKVHLLISDFNGDTIRNYKITADTGVHRINWHFERNGIPRVGYGNRDKTADPPFGRQVQPGNYLVQLTFGTYTEKDTLFVTSDPRTSFNTSAWMERNKMLSALDSAKHQLYHAFEQMKSSVKTMEIIQGNMEFIEKDKQKSLQDLQKTVNDTLKNIMNDITQPENYEIFDHVTQRLLDLINEAEEFIESSANEPLQNAQISMNKATTQIQFMLKRINRFYAEQWNAYQQAVTDSGLSIFKSVRKFKED
jgi:photosystem II stability/assembly factor-like uncharacterized protein